MLHTQRANFCKLHEEIMLINYQLLPTAIMVMLVIKAVTNVYVRCLLFQPDFNQTWTFRDFKTTPPSRI